MVLPNNMVVIRGCANCKGGVGKATGVAPVDYDIGIYIELAINIEIATFESVKV